MLDFSQMMSAYSGMNSPGMTRISNPMGNDMTGDNSGMLGILGKALMQSGYQNGSGQLGMMAQMLKAFAGKSMLDKQKQQQKLKNPMMPSNAPWYAGDDTGDNFTSDIS